MIRTTAGLPQVFPFVHTFPACDESRRTWIESTCSRCPATSTLLRRVPNIRTALFSRLGGGSRISGHRGWADLANHVLRCHLPLKVPSDGPCGLWVNEEVRRDLCVVMLRWRVYCTVLYSVRKVVEVSTNSNVWGVYHEVGVLCWSCVVWWKRASRAFSSVCIIAVSSLPSSRVELS